MHEYLKLRPQQLKNAINEGHIAYIPLGALEWHSYHAPLGLDGLKSEKLLRGVAEKIGKGVMFPCKYWGAITTMNFPWTFQFPATGQLRFYRIMYRSLYQMGFRIIVVLTGHYPNNQIIYLRKSALRFMRHHKDTSIIAIPEQVLLWDQGYFGDHAARYETSLAIYLFPELVDLTKLPKNLLFTDRCKHLGIMGQDPLLNSSIKEGMELTALFENRLVKLIENVEKDEKQKPIREMYSEYLRAKRKLYLNGPLNKSIAVLGAENIREIPKFIRWVIFKHSKHVPMN